MNIKMKDVTVSFKNGVTAVNHVNLEIPQGIFRAAGGKRGGKNHADAGADYCIEALLRNGADGRFGLQ